MKIILNGKEIELFNTQITYEEVVLRAGLKGYPTVTYIGKRNGDSRRSGEMHFSCKPVILEEGMVFNVIHTGNA